MDLSGNTLFENNREITLDPSANAVPATFPVSELTAGHAADDLVIQALLTSGTVTTASALLYLAKPKELKLTRPEISFTVEEKGSDWIISIRSDRVAKNILVNFNGRAGIFSDNYFDVLPGETTVISLPKSVSPQNPAAGLKIKSLVDTY
jgi:beta-mannosidase